MNNRTFPFARGALIAAAVIASLLILAKPGNSPKLRPNTTAGRAPNDVAKAAPSDQGGSIDGGGETYIVAIPEATTIAVFGQQAGEDKPARPARPPRN